MIDQKQKSGDDSVNIQIGEVNLLGLSYDDVKSIALDVFRNNFHKLSENAMTTAIQRVEEVTEKFLSTLMKLNPQGIHNASNPDFQYAFYEMQKEYALRGDKFNADMLIDVLIDKTKESNNQQIRQIVLNECIRVIPKLTKQHLSTLGLVMILKMFSSPKVSSLESFSLYIKELAPFIDQLTANYLHYSHLQYSSCVSITMGTMPLERLLKINYMGIFNIGFTDEELNNAKQGLEIPEKFICKCLHNLDKFQISIRNSNEIRTSSELTTEQKTVLLNLLETNAMPEQHIKSYVSSIDPICVKLFNIWDTSQLCHLDLTNIGMVIGFFYAKKILNFETNLSDWYSENS